MRIASILVLAELIPVESTVLTKSPGSTGVVGYGSVKGKKRARSIPKKVGFSTSFSVAETLVQIRV